jgi:glycerol kinase
VWQDRRTSKYCAELVSQGYQELIRDKTGLLLDAYFSATKLKFILDNVKGARLQANKGELAFGTIDSWLIWNLTNGDQHATDVTNASRTMLYNIHSMAWDEELLQLFDIPRQILPAVKSCDGDFGVIDKTLFGIEIPITGVAGDQHAALFGQQCMTQGAVKNTYGTGCFLMVNTGSNSIKSENKLLSTIAWQIKGETHYAMEGSIFISGAVIQWLKDGLQIIKDAKESEQLALSVQDNGGITFVPALSGLGAPHWDPYARGAIFGINRATSKAHIVRAALESIALQVFDVVKAMEQDIQHPLKELKVDGGGLSNEFLMQLQANLIEIDVVRPSELETTALGIAYIAGLGADLYETMDELKSLWKLDKRFVPSNNLNVQLLKQNWNSAINRSKNWIT